MYRGFRIISIEWSPADCYYNGRATNEDGVNVLFITGNFTEAYRVFEQAIDDYYDDDTDYRGFRIESIAWDAENKYFFGKANSIDSDHSVTFIDPDFSTIYTTFIDSVDDLYEFLGKSKQDD